MDALKVMLERRSIRKYRPVIVPDELLEEIVQAGLYALCFFGLSGCMALLSREEVQWLRALVRPGREKRRSAA